MRGATLFALTMGIVLSSTVWAGDITHATDVGPSIPHMDVSSYAGQLFWLAISFALLYTIMSKFALPRVRDILDRRHHTLQNNLERAAKIRDETEDIKIVYDKALRQADSHAQDFITNSINDMNQKNAAKLTKAMDKATSEIKKSQENIVDQKEKLLKKSEKLVDEIAEDLKNKVVEMQNIAPSTKKKRA